MNFNYLVLTFILAFVSACNVAEQAPKVDTTNSASKNTSVNLPNSNQVIKFRKDRDSLTESGNSVVVYIEREGAYLPEDQIINVKIGGSADLDDLDATSPFVVEGSNVTFLSGSTDTFEVKFSEKTVTQSLKITFNDDNMFEEDEVLQLSIVNNAGKDYVMTYPSMMGILIENNDSLPEVQFPLTMASSLGSPISVNENNPYSITVELSNNSYKDITVPVRIHADSVANSQDHTYVDRNFIIPAGQPSETFNFSINSDTFNELDEMLILEIGTPINAVRGASDYMHYIKIVDTNTNPTYDIAAADGSLGEAGDTEVLTLTLNMVAGQTLENELIVPVTITPLSGNIYKNVDYKVDKLEFTFPAGSSNGQTSTITVTGLNDGLYEESDETIQFTVADTDFAEANTSTADVTITDDEAAPVLQFISPTYLSQEGATFYLPIQISTPSDEPIVLSHTLATGGSNATPAVDHSILLSTPTTFTIPAGATSYQYPIMIYNDALFDQDETIAMTLAHSSGHGSVAGITTSTITIKEAGSLPTITFDSNIQSAAESATAANIGLTMSAPSEYPLEVTLTIQDNSTEKDGSNNPIDYSLFTTSDPNCSVVSTTVTINAGSTTCTLDMLLTQDSINEPTEQFELKIQQPNNMVIGTYPSHVMNILDSDSPPELEISFDGTAFGVIADSDQKTEGDSVQIYFHLDSPSGYDIIVNFTETPQTAEVLASDYAIVNPGTIVIPEGETKAMITVQTFKDNLYESGADEQVAFEVTSGANYDIATQNEVMLDIEDEDAGAPPSVKVAGLTLLETNENDIVNISFELSKPTSEDTTVQFEVDDTNECDILMLGNGDFETGIDNDRFIKCANIDETPEFTDSANLLAQLTGGFGEVTIPAGQVQGILTFKIDTDNLFENSAHTTAGEFYTRKEQFRITITDLLDSPGGVSIDGIDAEIDADDYIDINITDLDVVPVAYFANPFFKSHHEAAPELFEVPINLTSRSETDVTYHIQIIQQAEAGFNLADENDFYDVNTDPVGYETAFGNVDPLTVVKSDDDTMGSPPYLNSGLLYTAENNIIYEGQFTVPAYAEKEFLTIEFFEDDLYEGNEQFIIKLTDDPNEDTYNWGISYNYNEYKVTIMESLPTPEISWDIGNTALVDEGSEVEADIVAADATTVADLATTDVDLQINTTSISQHNSPTFEIALTGTATSSHENFDDNLDYMLSDYILEYDYIETSTDFTVSYNSPTKVISVSIPPGSGFDFTVLPLHISQDFRYEPLDDTIVSTIFNVTDIILGSNDVHTLTIDDDLDDNGENDGNGDYKPYVVYESLPLASYQEYNVDGWNLILSDESGTFTGKYITAAEATLEYTTIGYLRFDGSDTTPYSGTLTFSEVNDFTANFGVSSEILGLDPRTIDTVDFEMNTPNEAVLDDLKAYWIDPSSIDALPAYEGTYSLTFDDLNLEISKASDVLEDIFEDVSTSHTCTYYRGLVSCFGYNGNGQLGRGDTEPFGDDQTEDVTDQDNTLDLGSDSEGNPLYVKGMALGATHSCALFGNGRVKCWGNNLYGQLGSGSTVSNIGSVPEDMGDNLGYIDLGTNSTTGEPLKAKTLAASKYATCAIMSEDGGIKCWGRNNYGQLGVEHTANIGTTTSHMGNDLEFMKVSGNFSKITGGDGFFCAKREDSTDTLHCWGKNNVGQLGLNSNKDAIGDEAGEMSGTSVNIQNISTISQLVAANDHVCVNFSTSTYSSFNTRCWGNNWYGQLGMGRTARGTWRFRERYLTSTYTKTSSSSSNLKWGRGCNYFTGDGGNNCTSVLGFDQPDYNASYPYVSVEELTSSGHESGNNYVMRKPGTADNNEGANYSTLDVDVSNNQFVQLYYPTNSISGGLSFNCGAVKTTFGTGPAVTVRCWGSNIWYNGPDFDTVTNTEIDANRRDWGVLNNYGYSMWYIPWDDPDNFNGFMQTATEDHSCYDGVNDSYNNDTCEYINHFASVGDDVVHGIMDTDYGILTGGNYNVSRWYEDEGFTNDRDFYMGYTNEFPGSPGTVGINHEMHANSHSKFDFSGATSIDIKSGAFETCAMPKDISGSGDNSSIMCWGANHFGQLGVYIGETGCEAYNTIGDAWTCGARADGVELDFAYDF